MPEWWLTRVLGLLLAGRRGKVGLAAFLLACSTSLTIATPLVLRRAIDVSSKADHAALVLFSLVYIVVLAATVGTTWLQRVTIASAARSAMSELRIQLVQRTLALPIARLDGLPSGKLIASIMGDVDTLSDALAGAVLNLVADALLFSGMFVAMLSVDRPLALVPLAMFPCLVLSFIRFRRAARPRQLEVRRQRAELSAFLVEHLRGLAALQAADRTEWALDQCKRRGSDLYSAELTAKQATFSNFGFLNLVQGLGTTAVLGLGGSRCAAGTLTLGTLIAFLDYMRRYNEPILRWADQFQALEQARSAATRIFALLDLETEPATTLPRETTAEPRACRGALRFEGVWFSYEPGEPKKWALTDVSFEVPAGLRYAIVGPTGHGKSTILWLLLRFYTPQRGRILLDGEDLRSIPLRELRTRIGLITQDVRLFPGTIAENVLPGRRIDEEGARQAFGAIGALDMVDRLHDGVRTDVGEGGAALSQGERQLVVCARSVAREPEVLLLDEATASVDPVTEERLQASLEKLMLGRTGIVIAHRLSTVSRADRILVIEKGRVVEAGSRLELLAIEGRYAELERIQAPAAGRGA
jgi:ATP-binding cassette subfamily B protein